MIINGNALRIPLADGSVQTCVTSPPYYALRDYGVDGQIGLERSPREFLDKLVAVFREVWRVLRDDGTLWVNMGDSYANDKKWGGKTGGKHVRALHGEPIGRMKRHTGFKPKDLMGMPWALAFALRDDGWYLRRDIIWHKPTAMPESVYDRPTTAHEYIFLLSKSEHYYYDHAAIREPVSGGAHRRIKAVQGWATGPGSHSTLDHNRGLRVGRRAAPGQIEDGNKRSKPGSGVKYNDSFANATGDLVNERNKRSVWTVQSKGYSGAHFATYPPELIAPCILAGAPQGGIVLDPFNGSGTTVATARHLGRIGIGVELNPAYIELAKERNAQATIWEVPA